MGQLVHINRINSATLESGRWRRYIIQDGMGGGWEMMYYSAFAAADGIGIVETPLLQAHSNCCCTFHAILRLGTGVGRLNSFHLPFWVGWQECDKR